MDERVKAVISAAVVLAVDIAALFGVSLDLDALLDFVLSLAAVIATCWGIWKNHNFTRAAAQGQRVVDAIKSLQKTTDMTDVSAELALELCGGREENDGE